MTPKAMMRRKIYNAAARGLLLGLLLGTVFVAGFVLGARESAGADESAATGFPLLSEVRGLLTRYYLRPLPAPETLQYAAVRGYLAALNDPYTFFIDPPVAQNESEVLAGQYGGIGVQLQLHEAGYFVLHPFRDGPAAQAGVVDGDILVAVNGTPIVSGERFDVVDRLLRGEVGDGRGVTLTLRSVETGVERDLFVEFAVVQVPSVVWRVVIEDPRLGYVQVMRFTTRTPEELRTALAELQARGTRALILDLRSNSGGLLHESVDVASQFVDEGVIFYEVSRDGESEMRAKPGGLALDLPLVVLVNQSTASAAELVAGAIRDRARGLLIGQRSFGKGSVQLIFRLSDGSSLHVTTAEWLTPSRAPLDGVGLEPDISMIPAEDGRDVELGEAIRQLQNLIGQAG